MYDEAMVGQILKGIVRFNEQLGIWSFIIPIVFAVAVIYQLYHCYKHPSQRNNQYLLGIYAIIYIFGGYSIYIGKDFMGLTEALIGSIALWSISLLLILDIIYGWTEIKIPEKNILKYISWFLIVAGIFLYPLIELALGFTYPRMVFFGAECPTTISLIGILIGSIPKVNKLLFVIISLNAMFTGYSVAINGATFDFLYAFAGLLGTLSLMIYFKEIFLAPKKAGNSELS